MEILDFEKALELTGQYPFLSDESVSVSGKIKLFNDDFEVSEIPLYEPCGEGDHLYLMVEKRGMTTNAAVSKIAKALGVSPRDVGIAGQKDARAVTRQMMSVEHIDTSQVTALNIPGIQVIRATRHRNKLKMGHLKGNGFCIRMRNISNDHFEHVQQLVTVLEKEGVPNYFGTQRFGSRGDTGLVGRALLKGDYREALEMIVGMPTPTLEGEAITAARQLFVEGEYLAAADAWPRGFGENARLCRIFQETGGHFKKTLMAAGKKMLTFYVSAYQSMLFNRVLAQRIQNGTCQKMLLGDIAWKHDKGVCFVVENPDMETPRAERGEISPTGPLFGKKMKWPEGIPGEYERSLLSSEGISLASFSAKGPFRSVGGRRPLRVFPTDCSVVASSDDRGEFFQFEFNLPAGAYATVVLREICKSNGTEE